MTVAELIAKLQSLNLPDALIEIEGDEDGDYDEFEADVRSSQSVVLVPYECVEVSAAAVRSLAHLIPVTNRMSANLPPIPDGVTASDLLNLTADLEAEWIRVNGEPDGRR